MRRREAAGNDASNMPDNAPPLAVVVPVVW
jgi:hypothetical protein